MVVVFLIFQDQFHDYPLEVFNVVKHDDTV